MRAPTAIAILFLAALAGPVGCGGDDGGEPDPGPPAAETTPAPVEEQRLTAEERERVLGLQERVRWFCRQVGRFLAGERPVPTRSEFERAGAAIDAIGALAREKPRAELRPTQDMRLALADMIEDLTGANCSGELIRRANEALKRVPAT